jgi:hypothetical protein
MAKAVFYTVKARKGEKCLFEVFFNLEEAKTFAQNLDEDYQVLIVLS